MMPIFRIFSRDTKRGTTASLRYSIKIMLRGHCQCPLPYTIHNEIRNGEEKKKTGHRWRSRAAITNDSARRLYLLLPYDAYLLSSLLHCQCCYTPRQALPPNVASSLAHHVRVHSPPSSACLKQCA